MKTFRNRKQMGCDCNDDCSSLTLLMPEGGAQGEMGNAGVPCGYYKFDTSTAGTPVSGYLSFNASNLTAATTITINRFDVNSIDLAGWLVELYTSDSTNKAELQITSKTDPTKYVIYTVTAGSFASPVFTVTIVNVSASSNTPFNLNDVVVVGFSRTGNKGTNGTNGTNGTSVIYADVDDEDCGAVLANNQGVLKQFTVPANTLATDGDYIVVEMGGVCTGNHAVDATFTLVAAGDPFLSSQDFSTSYSSNVRLRQTIRIIRTSLTTYRAVATTDSYYLGAAYSLSFITNTFNDVTMGADWATNKTFSMIVYPTSGNLVSGDFFGSDITVSLYKQ